MQRWSGAVSCTSRRWLRRAATTGCGLALRSRNPTPAYAALVSWRSPSLHPVQGGRALPFASVPAGPRDYSQGTRAALAALSGGRCYEPSCDRPIIAFIGDEAFVDYQIAHIHDAKPGNRYKADMTDDERRAFSNLVLLCKPHHELVDKRHPEQFSAELLASWKAERERSFGLDATQLSGINSDELDDLVTSAAVTINATGPLTLGGAGGNAPGAGGGGGGAIGSNARGGDGGAGGQRYVLDGGPATSPGAGGGGGGAVGPEAVGGPGGDGGELVSQFVELTDDVVGARVQIGRAGLGGVEGPGGDGEDSVVQFLNANDEVVREVRAPGGHAHRAADDPVDATLSSLMLCNYVEVPNGLVTAIGAGWDHYVLGPDHLVAGVLLVGVESRAPGEARVNVRFVGPDGEVPAEVVLPLAFDQADGDLRRLHSPVPFAFVAENVGVWTVEAWTRCSSADTAFVVSVPRQQASAGSRVSSDPSTA